MSCDVGKGTERLENEQMSFSKLSVASPTSQLILQPFHRFTYVTARSPTLPLLHLRDSTFSSPSFASLRHRLFSYVTWRADHDMDRFSQGFSVFHYNKFHSTISSHSSHPFCFNLFHQLLWLCDRSGRRAALIFTDIKYCGFTASHPSIQPCVEHVLRMLRILQWAGSFFPYWYSIEWLKFQYS